MTRPAPASTITLLVATATLALASAIGPVAAQTACDLHRGPCRGELPGGGHATLSVTPRPIRPSTPLTLEVRVDGVVAEAVEVAFGSPGLDSSPNVAILTAVDSGLYTGAAILPVCIRANMTWRATVFVQTASGTVGTGFDFETVAPSPSLR